MVHRLSHPHNPRSDPELMRWVRAGVKPHGLEVVDWGTSFEDGRVFAALMATHAPSHISFDPNGGEKPIPLLQKAFDVAEKVKTLLPLL